MGHFSWQRSSFTHHASHPATATCPLCESAGAPRKFYARDRVHGIGGIFAIHRCEFCHAWFIQPWLSAEELKRFYPAEYGRHRPSQSLEKRHYRAWQHYVLENHYNYPSKNGAAPDSKARAIAFLLSFVTAKGVIPYRGAGRILDVGCGGGSYLYRLKQWGWDTYGVEPSKVGARRAQSLGLNVKQGMLEDARFKDDFFDVVRLSNVVEHLPNPIATFREIYRILQAQGLIYLTVTNTRSLVFQLFRENWYALDTPRHVISYSPKTLNVLAEATGFEVTATNFAAGPFNFVRSLNYLMDDKGSGWPREMRRIRWERSKMLRHALKPVFFVVDTLGYGDFLHATLRKKRL
jgi:SAM-dependent methyltransferase